MKRFAAIILILSMLAFPAGTGAFSADSQVGTQVGGFSSTDLYGAPVSGSIFSSYGASVVCYFATWSMDGLNQLAILQEIHDSHPEYGVFGLLETDGTSTVEVARNYMEACGYDFTVFVCDGVWRDVVDQTMFIPQSFIVNNDGLLVEAWQAAFHNADTLIARLAYWCGDPVDPTPTATPTPTPTVTPTESPTPAPTVTPTATPVEPGEADGDADLNGTVDMSDALLVLRCAMGLLTPTADNIVHGDIDGSGALDIQDALWILRRAMGLI